MNAISRDTEKQDAERVDQAIQMLKSGNVLTAKEILLQVIKNAPSPEDYVYQYEDDNSLSIKFWGPNEFMHYRTWQKQKESLGKNVTWILSAYPRAFYYLGFITLEQGDPLRAIEYLDKGAMLEPTNPKFTLEKGQAYVKMGDFQTGLNLYGQVTEMSAHVSGDDLAVALRGKGLVLIERGELELAESAFRESLRYDPESPVAANELTYIARLRQGGQKTKTQTRITEEIAPCMNCGKHFESGQVYNLEGRMTYLCEKCHGILTKK
jgi:tetratricopeptide (TPR) repeat protein